MKHISRVVREERQKTIVKLFDSLCGRQSRWTVWTDMVFFMAAAISNAVDKRHADEREKTYLTLAKKYSSAEMERFAQIFAEIVWAMDENPDQDLLGELYMALELGNKHNGQFFTPYCVCKAMAEITAGEGVEEKITSRGWVTVNDPACGAGATLIAVANDCIRKGINYQKDVLFVAQDIDQLVGLMCYIQLSLLGCPGYVVVADTISRPTLSIDDRGLIPVDEGNVWYTPFYFRSEWHWRRVLAQLQKVIPGYVENCPEKKAQPEAAAPMAAEPMATEQKTDDFGQLTLF